MVYLLLIGMMYQHSVISQTWLSLHLLVASVGPSPQDIQRKGAALAWSVSPGCLMVAPGMGSVHGTASTTLLSWQRASPVTMTRKLDPVKLVCYVKVESVSVPTAAFPGTAALPSVLVLKEREIVKRTHNALVT